MIPTMEASGGAEKSLHAVDPYLVELGFDIHLAVLTDRQDLIPELAELGVVVHDLSRSAAIALPVRLACLSRRIRADVVHASLFQAALPCQVAAPFMRAPLLVTWANTPTMPGEVATAAWKLRTVSAAEIGAAAVSRCRFHAVTEGVARTKSGELHVAPRRVRVAERGRDPGEFRPLDDDTRRRVRAELGVTGVDEVVLLAVGRQEPQKDYVLMLRAFDDAVSAGLPAKLFIAGREGAASADIQRVRASLRHSDLVVLLGQRDDVPGLLAAADAVVNSSRREGAAGALIEAMASGTPIVSVDLDGLVGVLENERNALVAPREGLALAIRRLATDPELRTRLASAARRTFLERFTVERSAQALAGVYRWAAGRESAPA